MQYSKVMLLTLTWSAVYSGCLEASAKPDNNDQLSEKQRLHQEQNKYEEWLLAQMTQTQQKLVQAYKPIITDDAPVFKDLRLREVLERYKAFEPDAVLAPQDPKKLSSNGDDNGDHKKQPLS